MRHALSGLFIVLLLAACQSVGSGLPPLVVTGMPWTDAPADQLALLARQALERGEPRQALRHLDTILEELPRHVDAHRLRQDVLRQRGRSGLLVREAQQAVSERPEDGLAHYLNARITTDPRSKLSGFRRAAELAPESVWPWLGLAHTLRAVNQDRALRIYERLFDASGQHALVGVAFAAALREAGRYDEAALVYQALRQDQSLPGVGDLGLAQVALARDNRASAWAALLQALRLRPFDPGVQALVHGWLETTATVDQADQVVDVLRENGSRLRAFGRAGGAMVLAGLLQQRGQPQAARSLLEARCERAPSPALRRSLRRLLLALGDVDAFMRQIVADVPAFVVDVEANQVRGRWLRLLRGPWCSGDAMASAERADALMAAMRDVGWLVEVELLAELALAKWPDRERVWLERQDEARGQLAFEAGMRRLLYKGYQQHDTADLATVLDRLRRLSQRVFGRDVVGEPPVFSVPLVGEMLDPFAGDLAAHLARYNRHLVLGRRSGGTAEGMLVTCLSVTELPTVESLELPGRCYEVVGIDRDVKALAGVLGGDLAGVALLNHFLIDFDAVVDWAHGLANRRRVAREDGLALLRDPLPVEPGSQPLDVAWRLTLASPVVDEDLSAAVLDMIRNHERQHLVDSFYYLPIADNLWRGLGLLFQFGLSPASIEAEMERRAELAALAVSSHTELVLAHIVDFFGDPPLQSPHHEGFSALVEQLRDELITIGVSPALAAPGRWHELPMERVREAASRLLEQLP